MSHRLQVLLPPQLDAAIGKAAARRRISKGEWVRQALEQGLESERISDPLARLAAIGAPTADIAQMLAEVEAGRD
jgi:hypothetical protein